MKEEATDVSVRPRSVLSLCAGYGGLERAIRFAAEFDLWVLLSGKPTRLRSSQVEWQKVPWIWLLSSTIWNPSEASRIADEWISLLPASLVRARASPASGAASTMSAGSGPRSGGSRKRSKRAGSSSRTSLASSPLTVAEHSRKSSGTWNRAGGLRNGIVSPRDPAAPRTSAIVSSCSLPTPSASQYGSSQNGINGIGGEHERPSAERPSLIAAARRGLLPTPVASDAGARGGETYPRGNETLIGAVRRLPTPTTNPQAPNLNSNTKNGPTSLLVAARMLPTPTTKPNDHRTGHDRRALIGEEPMTLLTAARAMLPTPIAMSARQVGARNNSRSGRTLTEAAATETRFLPTPVARDHKGADMPNRVGSPSLGAMAASGDLEMLPTPRASDATKGSRSIPERDGKEGPTLPEAINRMRERGLFPTPTTQDARASGVAGNWTPESGRNAGATLTDVAVRGLDSPSNSSGPSPTSGEPTGTGGGRLNPAFVEWMMGLPTGWSLTMPPMRTSSTSSATVSSPRRRPSRSSSSGTDSTAEQLSLMMPAPAEADE